MKPIKMKPCFKQYIWGGDNIKKVYKKDTPPPPVAESWEISAHPDGLSLVCGGEYDGMSIPELCEKSGKDFYGDSMKENDVFPLLLKVLDAEDRLSVQVHPDDSYANIHENGGKGKTEAWYILRANEGASLIYGFKDTITRDDFEAAIKEGRCEEVLNSVECHEGDVFYIPAGTIHAIGKGLMIAEIQQSSNTTYRVFDYNRRDKDGNLRELHVEKALDVSCTKSSVGSEKTVGETEEIECGKIRHIIGNEFFYFDEITLNGEFTDNTDNLLYMFFVAEGEFVIEGEKFIKGDSFLIPASMGEYSIKGTGKLLKYFTKA